MPKQRDGSFPLPREGNTAGSIGAWRAAGEGLLQASLMWVHHVPWFGTTRGELELPTAPCHFNFNYFS